jgi:hypothetical protein
MEILVTGRGTGGSWGIRGVQLGRAMGATVMPEARDLAAHDVAVLVKRYTPDLLERLHEARERDGLRIVWDVVDAWPQPRGNLWSREQCLAWLRAEIALVQPDGIVAATYEMLQDCKEFGVPVLLLPHHARPGLRRNPIRDRVRTVGYEGAPQYITRWRGHIEHECMRRGWCFEMQPAELSDVDILVALRDEVGYAPRKWKSGVKLANAQGSGTPVVCCREAGYLENDSGGALWADDPRQLANAFDILEPLAARRNAAAKLLAATPHLQTIAETYSTWLNETFPTSGR